jgi:hypothetical protein
MKNPVFFYVEPCRSCVNRRFGGMYRLHCQGKKSGITSQMTVFFYDSFLIQFWFFWSNKYCEVNRSYAKSITQNYRKKGQISFGIRWSCARCARYFPLHFQTNVEKFSCSAPLKHMAFDLLDNKMCSEGGNEQSSCTRICIYIYMVVVFWWNLLICRMTKQVLFDLHTLQH